MEMPIIIAIFVLIIFIVAGRKYRQAKRRRFIQTYTFPPVLRKKFASQYPELTEAEHAQVLNVLRHYFLLCSQAKNNMLAMPSQVVDDAWHLMILFTREYDRFCRLAFGKFLHHTPTEAMIQPTLAQKSIQRTWMLACKAEDISAKKPHKLPKLFSIDKELKIKNGFIYHLDCTGIQSRTGNDYCASHIGVDASSGCGGGCGGDSDSGSSCGGGCGGGGD